MIPLATEEFLRAYAAVTTFRICVKEIEIAGVRVMPGDRVAMSTTLAGRDEGKYDKPNEVRLDRSEEHTSELQSLLRTSYAVFCLHKNTSNIHSIISLYH